MDPEFLLEALPRVKDWVLGYVQEHAAAARPFAAHGLDRLGDYFSGDLLERARYVVVSAPRNPPLTELGLPMFGDFETMPVAGATYGDTVFVCASEQHDESLFFHELVHVVQWGELGFDRFLLAYGVTLLESGYEESAFEEMAYRLQDEFLAGRPIPDLEACVRAETRAIASSLGQGPFGGLFR